MERLIRKLVKLGWSDVEIRALLNRTPASVVNAYIKDVRDGVREMDEPVPSR